MYCISTCGGGGDDDDDDDDDDVQENRKTNGVDRRMERQPQLTAVLPKK